MKPNENRHVKKGQMRISRRLKKQLKAKHGSMWRWEAQGLMLNHVTNYLAKQFGKEHVPTMDFDFPVDGFGAIPVMPLSFASVFYRPMFIHNHPMIITTGGA